MALRCEAAACLEALDAPAPETRTIELLLLGGIANSFTSDDPERLRVRRRLETLLESEIAHPSDLLEGAALASAVVQCNMVYAGWTAEGLGSHLCRDGSMKLAKALRTAAEMRMRLVLSYAAKDPMRYASMCASGLMSSVAYPQAFAFTDCPGLDPIEVISLECTQQFVEHYSHQKLMPLIKTILYKIDITLWAQLACPLVRFGDLQTTSRFIGKLGDVVGQPDILTNPTYSVLRISWPHVLTCWVYRSAGFGAVGLATLNRCGYGYPGDASWPAGQCMASINVQSFQSWEVVCHERKLHVVSHARVALHTRAVHALYGPDPESAESILTWLPAPHDVDGIGVGYYDAWRGMGASGGPHADAAIDMYERVGRYEDGLVCAQHDTERFPFGEVTLGHAAVVALRCALALGKYDKAQQACRSAAERARRLKLRFLELLLRKELVLTTMRGRPNPIDSRPGAGELAALRGAIAGVVASPEELAPLLGGIDVGAAVQTAAAAAGASAK